MNDSGIMPDSASIPPKAAVQDKKDQQGAQAGAEPLRPALAELMACLETPLPEYEAGREAQDAWYERRDKAFKAARAALAEPQAEPRNQDQVYPAVPASSEKNTGA